MHVQRSQAVPAVFVSEPLEQTGYADAPGLDRRPLAVVASGEFGGCAVAHPPRLARSATVAKQPVTVLPGSVACSPDRRGWALRGIEKRLERTVEGLRRRQQHDPIDVVDLDPRRGDPTWDARRLPGRRRASGRLARPACRGASHQAVRADPFRSLTALLGNDVARCRFVVQVARGWPWVALDRHANHTTKRSPQMRDEAEER
jgi:hypothetical protein